MYKTTSILSAALLAATLGMTPAKAADLGGDCCADLEERVAELEATTVRKGNRKVSVKLSGQVNTGVLYWNDGVQSDFYVVDNTSSSSRFRITGEAKIHSGWTAGFEFEVEVTAGGTSSAVSQIDDDGLGPNGDQAMDIRKANWWIENEKLGRITVGQASPATDDITLIELGGTGVISNDTTLWGGGLLITRGGVSAAAGDTAASAIMSSIDTTSRSNVVRYDSPTIQGFTVSAAWGEDDLWDVALRYAGEFGGFRVAAGIGYIELTDEILSGQVDKRVLGSASVLHVSSGLFLTGFYNHLNDGGVANNDLTRWGLRAGIRQNLTGLGATVPYIEYQEGKADANNLTISGVNLGVGTDKGRLWGFGVVQYVDAAAMELFLGYKNIQFDLQGVGNVNDHNVVFTGARIKF